MMHLDTAGAAEPAVLWNAMAEPLAEVLASDTPLSNR